MLEDENYAGAASAVERVLAPLENLDFSTLARAALVRGKALLGPLVDQIVDEAQENPTQDKFREPWDMSKLALLLDPDNDDAIRQMGIMKDVMGSAPRLTLEHKHSEPFDVIIVGAGASGVGVALSLTKVFGLHPQRVLLIERGEGVGETFRNWPKEMRFISPSFNQQGWTNSFDLNSVAYGTSPAFTLGVEHPTGVQYARYLSALAEEAELCVRAHTYVISVRLFAEGDGFEVDVAPAAGADTLIETLRGHFVIWAAGEFQYVQASGPLFPGSEHCRHNSSIRSWTELPGDDFVVIGGFESGMDAASNLALCGKRCTVVSSTAHWDISNEDPSTELSPYTAQRIRVACQSSTPPQLRAPLRVCSVRMEPNDGGYIVDAQWMPSAKPAGGKHRVPVQEVTAAIATDATNSETVITLHTKQPPLLCTGFQGSVLSGIVKDLFEWGSVEEENSDDESVSEDVGSEENSDTEPVDHGHGHGHGKNDSQRGSHGHSHGGQPCSSNHEEEEISEDLDGKDESSDKCAENSPFLTKHDESSKTPGLFLVGPAVRHGELSFCFVYKFRQRFGVVANAIATTLGYDTTVAVKDCRDMNMFMDNFSCCEDLACGESC